MFAPRAPLVLLALIAVCLAGVRAVRADLVSDLESLYSFDSPYSPGEDTSGNGRHGTLSGAEQVLDPDRNAVVEFDASDVISAPLSGVDGSGFTVAMWAWRGTNHSTGNDGLFIASNGSTSTKTIGGWVNGSDQVWGRVYSGGGKSLPANGNATTPDETWTHLAFRGNGSQYELFVNGSPSGNSVGYGGTLDQTISDLFIGRQGTESWRGRIDDFRVYSRALTDQDISDLAALAPTAQQYADYVAFDVDGTAGPPPTQAGFASLGGVGPTSATALLTQLAINSSLDEWRDRATNGLTGSEAKYDLLRDFVFENDGQPAEIDIAGLEPNTPYQLTVYSFDSQANNGTQSEWYRDAIAGSPLVTHTIVSGNPDAASFLLNLWADPAGEIRLLAQPPGGGGGIVIFNGIEIAHVPEPSTLALFALGALALAALRRRRK